MASLQCSSVSKYNYTNVQMYKIGTNSPCTTGNIQYCSTALGTKQTHQKLSVVLCSRVLISNEDFPHTCCLSVCILISHTLRCCAQWLRMEYTVHHCDVSLSLKYIAGSSLVMQWYTLEKLYQPLIFVYLNSNTLVSQNIHSLREFKNWTTFSDTNYKYKKKMLPHR